MPKQMTWKVAILKVLASASEPLNSGKGVLQEIQKQGLRSVEEGNAPTVASTLSYLRGQALVESPSRTRRNHKGGEGIP